MTVYYCFFFVFLELFYNTVGTSFLSIIESVFSCLSL